MAARLEALGGVRTTIDFTAFREAATAALRRSVGRGTTRGSRGVSLAPALRRQSRCRCDHPRRSRLFGCRRLSSRAPAGRAEARRRATVGAMDVLLVPTTGTIYTKADVEADPIRLNSNLGYYTNFVNLMDLAAVAVPAGVRNDGLPFGVSLIGPAFSDAALITLERAAAGRTDCRPGPCPGMRPGRRGRRAPVRPAAESSARRSRRTARSGRAVPPRTTVCSPCRAQPRPKPGLVTGGRLTPAPASRWRSGRCRRIDSGASLRRSRRRLRWAASNSTRANG